MMRKPADEALVGRTIAGKFQIESFLGSGAMGAVYKARQVALDKHIAVKVMHADLAADPAFATRFQREARAASKLDHPNSVRIIDFGVEPDGLLYIAMELLGGQDLLTIMRASWPLRGERIVDILMQTLSALHVAHGQGIVHRDLKPENIMVLPGSDDEGNPTDLVKVCDFGIAKLLNDPRGQTGLGQTGGGLKGPLTTSGTLIGTPEYMSPEQGRGDTLDARSDLYSMGVILYQLLTGRVPFEAESAIGVILKHITDDPPRPTSIQASVDPRLEAICLKAMRKKREQRYQSAREMRADLRAVRDQARGVRVEDTGRIALGAPLPESDSTPGLSNAEFTTADTVMEGRGRNPPSAGGAFIAPSTGTPLGTAVERPSPPRRSPVLAVAAAALLLGVGIGGVIIVGGKGGIASGTADGGTTRAAATGAGEVPVAELSALVPAPTAPESAMAPPRSIAAPTSAHGRPVPSARGASAPLGKDAPPAPPVAPVTPLVPAAPAASTAAASPAPAPGAPEGPSFDPEKGWVEVGLVTPNNVKAEAVRAAVRQAPLTACYRNALRARATRATGVATLNLSIDEAGRVSGAVLTSAEWLPEMIRCVQGATAGLQLRPGSVESGGGTAEVWLSFRMQ